MDFDTKFDRQARAVAPLPQPAIEVAAAAIDCGALRRTTRLGGGFSNLNYLLKFEGGERCVLRVSPDRERLRMEADLMAHLATTSVPVPEFLWQGVEPLPEGSWAFAMSYIEGVPIAAVEDDLPSTLCRDICEQLAVAAAGVHSVRFEASGFLGPGPTVTQSFPSYSAGTMGFLKSCLDDARLKRRVGIERWDRLRRCVDACSSLHVPPVSEQLCHGDFNQKNLLVRKEAGRYRLVAVLDWEFALSASGLLDVGNLLRFEDESPAVDADWFAAAYRDAGGQLGTDWRDRALFADLLAQCSFLIDVEERPKTTATAISVIDRTLAALDS